MTQITFILRQGEEGAAVGEVCWKAGISEATYYNSEMKRLRHSRLRIPTKSPGYSEMMPPVIPT